MAYAIMRWSKVTSQVQADKATGHNYRTDRVPNADEQAPHPNVELVNTAGRGYWELAEERIAEVVTRKVRDDQVRCMEVILTASPEFFERDESGRAVDMQASKWAADNLQFLKDTFGEKNVLSFTLHQDEKSPHVHAVITPITADGRLSAKELFNPRTLTTYQSQYAEAMTVHGLSRGVEHSQAQHQDMRRMYGQRAQVGAQLAGELGQAVEYQPVQVASPGRIQLNPEGWAAEQSARVNEQARQQVEAANQRAEKAEKLALASTAAVEQVQSLRAQLHTSEELKERNYAGWQQERAAGDDLARRLAGGEPTPTNWLARGNALLDQDVQAVQAGRVEIAQLHQQAERAEKMGDYGQVADLRYGVLVDKEKGQQEAETHLSSYAGGATRLAELNAERTRAQAEQERLANERAAQQAEQVRLAKEREATERAERARLAQEKQHQLAEQQRQIPIIRENERQRIEQITNTILRKNPHVYELKYFVQIVEREGIKVENPEKGRLVLSLVGSQNQFEHRELKPGGEEFGKLFNQALTTNNARLMREVEREQKQASKDQGFGIG